MTVHARSDICAVTISVAHGGCGQPHSRPVEHGAPARKWAVTCAACETFLHNDPNWATSEADIPETPDEAKGREDFEKRGAADRDTIMAAALAKLAGVELPPALRGLIGGAGPAAIAGMLECPSGHGCDPGSKFCGECGRPLAVPAARQCPSGHDVASHLKFCGECGTPVSGTGPAALPAPDPATGPAQRKPAGRLKDMRADDLRALAAERGLDSSGTRTDLIARLKPAA